MKTGRFLKGVFVLNLPVFLLVILMAIIQQVIESKMSWVLWVLTACAAVFLSGLYYYLLLSRLTKRLDLISTTLEDIADGKLDKVQPNAPKLFFIKNGIQDSIQSIVLLLNRLITSIDNIAEGKLDTTYTTDENSNELDLKLLKLTQTLKNNNEVLEKTKLEEQKRNWVSEGLAKFSDILRQDNTSINKLGYNLISNLVDYIQFNQGALYVIKENEEEAYENIAAVAYDRQKNMKISINLGEGLVGRCAFEKKSIYLKEIPEDYMHITSGLGTANPQNLLIVPCILEGKVYGIIEVASFKLIEQFQIDFIEKLGESIASTIATVRNSVRTGALLRASQTQSEELAAQEEELRQNLEEMETTQDELRRQMDLNEEMQKTLSFEKFLFDTLLENIPARINFKDRNRKYIRASKSLLTRFGKASLDEIIGKTDEDFFEAEFAKKTKTDDSQIMESMQGRINFIEHEVKDNGEEIWKNVTKIPLLNEKSECVGLLASVYDITDFKNLEAENQTLKNELERLKKKE